MYVSTYTSHPYLSKWYDQYKLDNHIIEDVLSLIVM